MMSPRRREILILALLVGALLLLLTGCIQTDRQGQRVRRWSEQGEQGGVPFAKSGEETIDSHSTSHSSVDPQAIASAVSVAMRAGAAAGTGGLSEAIPTIVGGLTTAGAAAAYLLKRREANQAWDAERAAAIEAAKGKAPA